MGNIALDINDGKFRELGILVTDNDFFRYAIRYVLKYALKIVGMGPAFEQAT